MTPTSTELEQQLQPLQRLYIKALLHEAAAEHAKEHDQLKESFAVRIRALNEALAEERAHTNKLERLIGLTPASRRRLGEMIDAINRAIGE